MPKIRGHHLRAVLAATVLGDATVPDVDSWEPTDAEQWGSSDGRHGPPFAVPSVVAKELSQETFDELVREGRVFSVRGVGEGHPMRSWGCEYFSRDEIFRDVLVKREYATASARSDPDRLQPPWVRLKDLFRSGENASSLSPYYLGIKDAIGQSPQELADDPHASVTWSKAVLRKVQEHTIVPAFMDKKNKRLLRGTPELWFSAGKSGGGAKAHVDVHTQSTMSLQLSGQKRWRVAPIRHRAAQHVMKLYQDGAIYERREAETWNIFEDIVLEPGDAIFFGPGFIHQTEAESGDCASSITWQFDVPSPVHFWRRFLPRIRRTPDLHHSWPLIRRLIPADGVDSDGNGYLDFEELRRAVGESATDALGFLDVDGDGRVQDAERAQVLAVWNTLQRLAASDLPSRLRRMKLGLDHMRVVEDRSDLDTFSKKERDAVLRWEAEATARDEVFKRPSQRSDEL